MERQRQQMRDPGRVWPASANAHLTDVQLYHRFLCREVKTENSLLYVGIDVSSRNNVACLRKPDGSKHSNLSAQNNIGGAKLLSERIVLARIATLTRAKFDVIQNLTREKQRFANKSNKFQCKRPLAFTVRKTVRLFFRLLKDDRLYHPAYNENSPDKILLNSKQPSTF